MIIIIGHIIIPRSCTINYRSLLGLGEQIFRYSIARTKHYSGNMKRAEHNASLVCIMRKRTILKRSSSERRWAKGGRQRAKTKDTHAYRGSARNGDVQTTAFGSESGIPSTSVMHPVFGLPSITVVPTDFSNGPTCPKRYCQGHVNHAC